MKNRSRLIAPEFWESESVADLTIRQRLLFLGIISNADDQGRMKGNPKYVNAQVFPYDDITGDEILVDLEAIMDVGGIIFYEVAERQYIQIVKWWTFQHPTWSQPSELPPPEGWKDRWHYRTGKKVASYNWPDTPDSNPSTNVLESNLKASTKQVESNLPYNNNMNDNNNSKDKDNAAPKAAKPKSSPYTETQREFLALFGAKRFKTNIARDTIRALEEEYGHFTVLEAGQWAAKRQMSVGAAVVSVESALKKGWNNKRKPPVNEPRQHKWHDRPRWEVLQEEALRKEAEKEMGNDKKSIR